MQGIPYVKVLAGALLGATVALAGCQTVNPYTGEQETSNATSGAGIGAAIGAVAGAATGDNAHDRRRRALIGAGIGALAGGSVGYYMDRQEAELRKKLRGTGVSVTRDGNNIILNMPGNITFRTDSADLNPGFHDVLDSVTAVLQEYEKTMIQIDGYTDSTGAASYNQALSQRRAQSVSSYLVRKGIDQRRTLVQGFGEKNPVASNATADGRARNRRVELTLIPLTQN